MTYDFPIWVFEGEVANFKEEGLVTPAGGKRYFEGEFVHAGNWTYVKGKSVDHYMHLLVINIRWTILLQFVL